MMALNSENWSHDYPASEMVAKPREGEEGEREGSRVEVISLWSCPRSLSTSLMYSFAQRTDTEVLDEPLYPHWLHVTGTKRPYRDELLANAETDAGKVLGDIINRPSSFKYRMSKHIAKQRTVYVKRNLLATGKHFILIRDPLASIASFEEVVPASISELGLMDLLNIYIELTELGNPPPVIDATDLQKDPEGVLRALCDALSIPFQETMLRWKAGPKPEDGMWAPWWYGRVHKSTEFSPPSPFLKKPFPMDLYGLLEYSQPIYDFLKRHALRPTSAAASVRPSLPVSSNENLLIWVGDRLVPREDAKVSVFDSIVQGGDGVWEGLRIYKGKIFKFEEHLDRLFDSAKAMAFSSVPSRLEVKNAVFATLIANGMRDSAHVRLTLTRGKKVTSGMSPHFNQYGSNLLVLAEWKPAVYDNSAGIRLITASTRRNSPNSIDSKIHHNNLINNILAKVEGNLAGADDAIMLDCDGFVSETNATNLFMVKKGLILTPHADYCLPGITRATVIQLAKRMELALQERRISLSEFHTADEVWTTGTMGELSPVIEIDGRTVRDGQVGPTTRKLQQALADLVSSEGVVIPNL